ncbi:DNA polymerase III subunit delta [Bombella intestini]|uniref:DNA-directed DNA polymerase n=1 Tax=Bombella intestini TaxID=1539051 RepID=A0A1S8GQG9_9PROT|nr:DNA polymerase III subunit delta [Bombella intestini]OOL18973.1 DNA polymerase III subunit delta [Bombella intestini]
MKITAQAVRQTLKKAGSWRVILLHGDDGGLIRERAKEAVQTVLDDLDDPFRLARLEEEEQDRLGEEALALSLTGGRRVVWLRGAQDGIVGTLKSVLEHESDTLIVLEGQGLGARSKLRQFAEKAKNVASIGCYPEEGHSLSRTVVDLLAEDKIRMDRDGMAWLLGHLGNDRALVRSEVEKLRLYGEPGGTLSVEDVQACVGDSGQASLDDAVYAALAGNRLEADRAFERAMGDGATSVAFTRVTLSVLERFQQAFLLVQNGQSRQEAMGMLKPPVFFRRKDAFLAGMRRWSLVTTSQAAQATQELELACKQSGTPDDLLCRRHLVRLCHPRAFEQD